MRPLTKLNLAWTNLIHHPLRTICLAGVAAVLAFTLFGGALLTAGLNNGMDTLARRFGADLMVVPEGYKDRAEKMLLGGEPSYFFLKREVVGKVASIDGVAQVTPQFFLCSLSAECCDVPVQLIAFDPTTDFVIQPWLAEQNAIRLRDGELLCGADIQTRADGTIKLFDESYPVVTQLSRSASGLDSAIFMTEATMRAMVQQARAQKFHFLNDVELGEAVSAILVRLTDRKHDYTVMRKIRTENSGVDIITSTGTLGQVAATLRNLTAYIRSLAAGVAFAAAITLIVVFSGSINERKKELAILRVLGATRSKVAGIILAEALLLTIAGGLLGLILAAVAIFPFNTYIGARLQLPYLPPALGAVGGWFGLCLAITTLAGLFAALASVGKIARAETYLTLRSEG